MGVKAIQRRFQRTRRGPHTPRYDQPPKLRPRETRDPTKCAPVRLLMPGLPGWLLTYSATCPATAGIGASPAGEAYDPRKTCPAKQLHIDAAAFRSTNVPPPPPRDCEKPAIGGGGLRASRAGGTDMVTQTVSRSHPKTPNRESHHETFRDARRGGSPGERSPKRPKWSLARLATKTASSI